MLYIPPEVIEMLKQATINLADSVLREQQRKRAERKKIKVEFPTNYTPPRSHPGGDYIPFEEIPNA